MIDRRFVELVERIGYINKAGRHVYGTAALLHYLSLHVDELDQHSIVLGKEYAQKYLTA